VLLVLIYCYAYKNQICDFRHTKFPHLSCEHK